MGNPDDKLACHFGNCHSKFYPTATTQQDYEQKPCQTKAYVTVDVIIRVFLNGGNTESPEGFSEAITLDEASMVKKNESEKNKDAQDGNNAEPDEEGGYPPHEKHHEEGDDDGESKAKKDPIPVLTINRITFWMSVIKWLRYEDLSLLDRLVE